MTTEDDFQRALDKHPDDWQTRLVFADWLQEQGDPRAEGYRALGVLRLCPFYTPTEAVCWWTTYPIDCVPKEGVHGSGCSLEAEEDWYEAIKLKPSDEWFKPLGAIGKCTRRKAEDAAALGFTRLPPERRAQLLAQPPKVVPRPKPQKPKPKPATTRRAKAKPAAKKSAAKKRVAKAKPAPRAKK